MNNSKDSILLKSYSGLIKIYIKEENYEEAEKRVLEVNNQKLTSAFYNFMAHLFLNKKTDDYKLVEINRKQTNMYFKKAIESKLKDSEDIDKMIDFERFLSLSDEPIQGLLDEAVCFQLKSLTKRIINQ